MAKCSPARKARLRARHQAEMELERQKCAVLRAANCSCATCAHARKKHMRKPDDLICLLDSDFYGDRVVKPTDICSRFELRI